MMTDTARLRQLLIILRDDLKQSKNNAYEYIESLITNLSSALTSTKLKQLLIQIKSGSKIVDYANFNSHQEKLWLDIWKEVTRILEK